MDNREIENKTLSIEELEKVAGGKYADNPFSLCLFGCKGSVFENSSINDVRYEAWKCDKCGHEIYLINGERVSPASLHGELNTLV